MTPIWPDGCEHGIETYIGTMYNKDIYLLPSGEVLCVRYGKMQDRYISIDVSSIPNILHHHRVGCHQLVKLVKAIVRQGEKYGKKTR